MQLQLIVTGAHRQISMLESDAFASLNNKETPRADAHRMVLEIQQRIEDVVDKAIKQVEGYADPEPRGRGRQRSRSAPPAPPPSQASSGSHARPRKRAGVG